MSEATAAGKIRIILHIYATAISITDEILFAIHATGLYRECHAVHCFVTGPDPESIERMLAYLSLRGGPKIKVERCEPGDTTYERFTLENMFDLIDADDFVLYMHTKGSSPKYLPGGDKHVSLGQAVQAWCRAILMECTMRWRDCVAAMGNGSCDIVGPCYRPQPVPHYRGNFWWARGDYLLTRVPRKIDGWYWAPELNFVFVGSPKFGMLDPLPLAHYDTIQPMPT
jgi:hypothetical protein